MPKSKNLEAVQCEKFQEILNRTIVSGSYAVERAKREVVDRIHDTMTLQGVNKAELARRLGTSRMYITKILQGETNLTIDSIVKIATALECEIDFSNIFVGKAEPATETICQPIELPLTQTQNSSRGFASLRLESKSEETKGRDSNEIVSISA